MIDLYYIFCFICVILVILYLIIKYKYKFWILQPVFHYYDFSYWFYNKGIIMHDLPIKNKYVNQFDIKTYNFEDVQSNSNLHKLVFFIQKHYFRNKENKFYPQLNNITPYFLSHHASCFVSFFYDKQLLRDKTNNIIENKQIIGLMTSRPLHVFLKKETFDVYYVDYLCVDKHQRKRGVAPQIIQTHEYHQRHHNKNIQVSLFKREGELTGIVPLCVYNTICFNMTLIRLQHTFPASLNLLTLDSQNIHHLVHFMNTIEHFDMKIYPDMGNLLELVSSKNIKIFMVLDGSDITAVYVYRKTCIYIDKSKEIVSCIASIKSDQLSKDLFVSMFEYTLFTIANKFGYLCIENISDNHYILKHFEDRYKSIAMSPCAYFFYNYAYRTLNSNKLLILH